MRITAVILALGILALLPSCTSTKSGVHKQYDITVHGGEGDMQITLRLDAEAYTDTTSGDAPASTELDAALSGQGATSGAGDNVEIIEPVNKYTPVLDNSKTDSENTTSVPATLPPLVVVPDQPDKPIVDPELGPATEVLFAVEMVMTEEQDSPEMGFWFTDSELLVEWEGGAWEDKSTEDIFIKKSRSAVGNVMFSPEIPTESTVSKATLTLVLEPDEGQAYGDTQSTVEFRDMDTGEVIQSFVSGELDCAKHDPRCEFDFTEYVKGLR